MLKSNWPKSFATFKQAFKFLNSLDSRRKVVYHTNNIEAFLRNLDNPQDKIKTIHVAGTSGKGSVCHFLSYILTNAGYKTGLTISPYLIHPLERIQINNKRITEKQFLKLINQHIDQIYKYKLTYFETFIALAFIYFKQAQVDYAIIETGLGGRYDATNVLRDSTLVIITNIGLDHTDILGKTIKQIASEKEQIIKNNKKAITGSKLIKKAKFINTKNYKIISQNMFGSEFFYKQKKYNLKLCGEFQVENAVLAIAASKFLKISEKYIKLGLQKAKHFGRFEIISKNPLIIVDGAHNQEKIKAFTRSLKKIVNLNDYKNKYLLLAIKNDKDYKKIIKILTPLFNNIVITKFGKSYNPYLLKKYIQKLYKNKQVKINHNPQKAYLLIKKKTKNNDILVVTGSLYLIRDIFS